MPQQTTWKWTYTHLHLHRYYFHSSEIRCSKYTVSMSTINFDRYYQIAFHLCYMKSLFPPTLQRAMDTIALFHFSQANECEMIYHLFPISSLWLLENSVNLFKSTLTKCWEKGRKFISFLSLENILLRFIQFFPFSCWH